ncbi:sugar transporter ERD6-like 5 [Hibiscus syriacus]|uniref:sugar transporter ERD6-like 5 n=1 Tax=Hibiscus syriacus TaxID=106335 RepID=UPI0019217F6C|nr:sugar transporter ERD6-like 5 [Hibiscus syriacus]
MPAIGISEVFCITGWLAIVFSKDAWWLDLGRFLVGCGSEVLCYVIPLYLSEITPKNVWGAFASLFTVMLCCGKAVMFIIGSLINWRTSALIGIVPCVLQLMGGFLIPESPRWLVGKAKTNETKEFEATRRRLRGEKTDIYQEATDIRLYTEYMQQITDGGLRNLFQKRYISPLIVRVELMVFQQFGGLGGFSYYTSFIFKSAGFPSKVGSIAIAVLQILMAILGVLFIGKFGRRPLLLISAGGTCLGCVITGLPFFLQVPSLSRIFDHLSSIPVKPENQVFLLSFDLGMGGIPWIIVSEIFPMNIKGSGESLVNLLNWASYWVVSYTFTFLFKWNSAGTFFIFAFIGDVGIIFIGKLVLETKGRTLEALQTCQ